MNYYERHIGDYLKDTAHLSLLEHGVYTRLLDVYYTRESGIPVAEAARLVGARSKDEKAALSVVLEEFFRLEGDTYVQERCTHEIARFHEKSGKARASANARWKRGDGNANAMRTHTDGNAGDGCDGNANASETHDVRNALHTPDTSTHTPGNTKIQRASAPAPAAPTALVPVSALVAEGVDADAARDWLRVRKEKRAPLTETAWEGVKREAASAGLTPADAVRIAAENSWQGFKAAWMHGPAAKTVVNRQEAIEQRNRAVGEEWLRKEGVIQ